MHKLSTCDKGRLEEPEKRDDGGLWDVVWEHLDLIPLEEDEGGENVGDDIWTTFELRSTH